MARAMPGTGVLTQHVMQLQLTAKQTVDSMTSFLKLLLLQEFRSLQVTRFTYLLET
jgi:hypothetical protein